MAAAAAATTAGREKQIKNMLKSFLAAVQLSASVERFGVSRMRDFFPYNQDLSESLSTLLCAIGLEKGFNKVDHGLAVQANAVGWL